MATSDRVRRLAFEIRSLPLDEVRELRRVFDDRLRGDDGLAGASVPLGDTPKPPVLSAAAPSPGSDATTADGRFVSGSGYGGERM